MIYKMQKDNCGRLLGSRSYPRTICFILILSNESKFLSNESIFFELIEVLVIEHLESAVRNQYLRYADTLWSLVVLQDGCYDTWQGESRTVQGVAKLNLLVLCMAVAAVETVSLVALEVRY